MRVPVRLPSYASVSRPVPLTFSDRAFSVYLIFFAFCYHSEFGLISALQYMDYVLDTLVHT